MSAASFQSEINEIPHKFSKLLFDVEKLKKPEKIASTYHIASGERILGYIKSTVPLFTLIVDGTIITDRAIYIHPSHDDWAASNRFPFDEICKYFVYMDDEKSNVYMSDIHSKSIIRGCTLFGRNTGGIELMQFVKALQAILLSRYTWAQEQRQTAVAELLTAARASMKTGRVSQELSVLLNAIEPSSPQYLAVKLVQAEDVYRSCDADAYHRFMENTTAEARAAIMQQQNSFEKALQADLSNIYLNFETNYLTEAYTNLSASPYRSDTDTLLFAYICVRLDKKVDYTNSCRQVKSDDAKQVLEAFSACYYNTRMLTVYEAIETNQPLRPEWLNWTDSMGLTPLHYAIILKKSSLVDNLLDSQVWDDACPFRKEDSASRVYDYNVLASIVGFPGQINLIKKTSKAVASQIRSLRAIEKQLTIQRKKLDFQNATRLTLQRAIYNASHATAPNQYEQEEKIESAKVKLENLNEAIEYTKEKIADLESSLDEVSAEIEDLIGTVRTEADQTADDIKNSGDAFVRYLYRLFTDADMLCHVLSHSEEGCRLYSYNGFIFASPADVSIDLPFRIADLTHGSTYQREANKEHSEQRYSSSKGQQHSQQASSESSTEHTRKKKSDEPIQRPYGKNWFSPQAHSDMKTLTKEYHRLAKQYHPDVCEHSRSQEIFQEILTERAEILEHMAQ